MKKNESVVGVRIGIYDVLYECDYKAKDGHKLYHIKCSECGWETDMQKAHIGRATCCTHKKKEIELKKCLNCDNEITIGNMNSYEYGKRKFCCRSCNAQYNNKKFPKRKSKKEKEKFCINCGIELNNGQTKYCSHQCQYEYSQKQFEEKWLNGEISGNKNSVWTQVSKHVKTYLLNKYDNKCARCGWSEVNPYTGKIPLEVEHIDGNAENTTPENVTLLCPNCHSLTATYRGANRGKGRQKTWIPKTNLDVPI